MLQWIKEAKRQTSVVVNIPHWYIYNIVCLPNPELLVSKFRRISATDKEQDKEDFDFFFYLGCGCLLVKKRKKDKSKVSLHSPPHCGQPNHTACSST